MRQVAEWELVGKKKVAQGNRGKDIQEMIWCDLNWSRRSRKMTNQIKPKMAKHRVMALKQTLFLFVTFKFKQNFGHLKQKITWNKRKKTFSWKIVKNLWKS